MTTERQDPFAVPAPPVWLDRRTPPHLGTLVAISAVSALNMNIILPSLPSLARHYDASYSVVALAISAYLALTAVLQLFIGPLSDRYGRRPVVLVCFGVFLVATLGCVLAPNVQAFLAFRLLQTTVVVGLVLTRAIVRDMVPTDQAASMIGYVTMGMSVAPMIGPMLGGFLDETLGWQAIFVATFLFGLAMTVLAWFDLGETNAAPSPNLAAQFRAYPELIRSRRFWGYAATAAFASGAFFALLGGAPWVGTQILHMSPSSLGFHFGIIAVGYMIGNFLSGRYTSRVGLNTMMAIGGVVSISGVVLALVLFGIGIVTPLSFFGPILFVGLGNGLALPSANAGMVSVRPHLAGSASGLGGALMIGGGAALSVLAGALLGPGTGAWPLLIVMLISATLGLVASVYVIQVARRRGPLQS